MQHFAHKNMSTSVNYQQQYSYESHENGSDSSHELITNEDEVCAIDGYVSVQENNININLE